MKRGIELFDFMLTVSFQLIVVCLFSLFFRVLFSGPLGDVQQLLNLNSFVNPKSLVPVPIPNSHLHPSISPLFLNFDS